MVAELVLFELRYHLRRASTYVYFALVFLAAFASMATPAGGGAQLVDAPWALARQATEFSAFGVIIISAICGMAVCRDFELDVYPLIFTRPIRRRDYLAGRWLGSLIVCALVFVSLPIGMFLGTWMPWVDRTYRMPFAVWPFVQPYFMIVLTTVFFTGTIFFAVGALTRRVAVVYLQGVLFLGVYLLSRQFFPSNLNDYWPALFDPVAMTTVAQATKYWTIVERNSQLVPLAGVVLENRLLWCGLGALGALAVFRYFPFSTEALFTRRRSAGEALGESEPAMARRRPPIVHPRFGWQTAMRQFRTLTRLRLRTIVTDFVFLALVAVAVVEQIGRVWGQPYAQNMPVYPVTYLMVGGAGGLIAIVITAIYAGEFVWRDRQIGFDQVHDALPAGGWLNVLSRFAALALVQAALLGTHMLTGIAGQAIQGYYRFELGLYFKDIFILQYPVLLQFAALALFVQTVSPSKFLGHVIVIATFLAPTAVLMPLAERLQIDVPADLWAYGGRTTPYIYSDMNGYGPFATPLAWLTTYWTLWAALLTVGAVLAARRGTDTGWRRRMRLARSRARPALLVAAALLMLAAAGAGGWVYYNDRVLNADTEPAWVNEARQARYEREYKQYEGMAQPKVIDVETRIEIYPRSGTASATGTLTLQNKAGEPVSTLHVLVDDELREVSFDRPAALSKADDDLDYWIYTLASPLAPGETMALTFTSERTNPGFLIDPPTDIVANGTFFNNGFMPNIGYNRARELSDPRARARQGLGERAELPDPEAPGTRMRSFFFTDADWVSYKAIVGTDDDQIAITPGYLVREWTENGRRYFEYDLSDVPTHKFFSYLSGRFDVKRELWNGVSIEVHYHPAHTYNVDRMVAAARAGLEYFSENFGPYHFRQFRIIELPRYLGAAAQSFANTVSYSEGAGFISNPTGDDDLDGPYYITLHELAHQWWAHQLAGAGVKGSNMLSESLAEYSALMVTEKTYGPEALRLYLRHDLDSYLRGRANELRRELTLARSSSGYVMYRKGSLAMYALKDYLGEDVVNGVLRRLLGRFGLAKSPPYPTTDDLIAELRAVTPDDLQYFITDLFETITLYDNRALEATWRQTEDGKYAVTVKVQSGKVRADDQGIETPTPMNDLIDIGVFTGRGKRERALYLQKHRLAGGEATFEIVVDEQPTRAGIDPYNKLIDRVSGDNVVAVAGG